jgi:hypothetical protein
VDGPGDESDFEIPAGDDLNSRFRPGEGPGAGDRGCPTPGERLFYTLCQMQLRYDTGEFDLHPRDWDVEDLAKTIGVWHEVEYMQEDALGEAYHFASQVVHVDPEADFPWRLMSVMAWAVEQELNDMGPEESD